MYNTYMYMYLGDSEGNGYNDVRPTPLYSDHLSITTRLVHDLAWSLLIGSTVSCELIMHIENLLKLLMCVCVFCRI
jgi:hypothetical protein